MAHGPSYSAACGIFPDQGSNPCPLHWQADSQPLRHQGSPRFLSKRKIGSHSLLTGETHVAHTDGREQKREELTSQGNVGVRCSGHTEGCAGIRFMRGQRVDVEVGPGGTERSGGSRGDRGSGRVGPRGNIGGSPSLRRPLFQHWPLEPTPTSLRQGLGKFPHKASGSQPCQCYKAALSSEGLSYTHALSSGWPPPEDSEWANVGRSWESPWGLPCSVKVPPRHEKGPRFQTQLSLPQLRRTECWRQ